MAAGRTGLAPPPDYARAGGPWDVPTLTDLKPAPLVDGNLWLTSSEVAALAGRAAAGLSARGVVPGSTVAWQLPNWWEALVLFHACWRLGAIAFPVHHRLGASARQRLLERTDPRVVLAAGDRDAPPDAIPVRGDGDGFRHLLDAPDPAPSQPPRVDGADLAVVLATSGSTGEPKLVAHHHRALAGKARTMQAAHGLTSADTVLMPAPLSHISGLLNGVLVPGQAGMTSVLMDRWDPEEAVALADRWRVSFMIGPPTFFADLAGATRRGARTLRLVSCGGAAVTPAFVRWAQDELGAFVKRTYGSTEAPTVTTWQGGPLELAAETDGQPTTDVEVRVVDPASGAQVPAGQLGELLVRGPELFARYLDDPAQTSAALDPDGWFRTADLARLSPDGWLTVVGRADDKIIRGGENVSPAEVEAACATLPGIGQVVVLGYPDERLGERVGLVATGPRAPTLDEVAARCAAAGLARFAWPERILRVEALPLLGAGKPDRRHLSRLLAAPTQGTDVDEKG